MKTVEEWKMLIGSPSNYNFEKSFQLIKKYELDEINCEVYLQANGVTSKGETTFQKVIMSFPKKIEGRLPAVVVPFYYPEAMLGFDPETNEKLERFKDYPFAFELAKRGYITISAQAYHLTYIKSNLRIDDFQRWKYAADALNSEHPNWSGVGKLIFDTRLLIDALESDMRVNPDKLGIIGHSLGGKMAFYTGCLDERIKVIVASDFGIKWEQTNWEDSWYWGEKLKSIIEKGITHKGLLAAVRKPFCLIAGQFDNEESRELMYSVEEYKDLPDHLLFIHHGTGHKPISYAKEAGYAYLDYWLK